jgi:(p)ppGpp synthase/HD superfamily hydrolase
MNAKTDASSTINTSPAPMAMIALDGPEVLLPAPEPGYEHGPAVDAACEAKLREIRALACRHHWPNTQKAIPLAARCHRDQHRKTGAPYIIHPIMVASQLLLCGVRSDTTLASAFLHDVLEDCPRLVSAETLRHVHLLDAGVVEAVKALSKHPGQAEREYYEQIGCSRHAILVKLADRWHNISTMDGVFSAERKAAYIAEAFEFILPLRDEYTRRFADEGVSCVDALARRLEYAIANAPI